MSHRSRRVFLCAALLLAVGCGRPFVLLPGGALEGTVTPVPESWAFTDDIDTIQLETRPADPYSVNIWVIALDDHLYVHAGANRAAWVENMESDPAVRIGIDGAIYELASARVEGQDEFDRFSDAYEKKYERRPRNEDVGEAYLFRLGPR
ncbi:MAG: DUF2255 family protein [Myxococcota bacterium]